MNTPVRSFFDSKAMLTTFTGQRQSISRKQRLVDEIVKVSVPVDTLMGMAGSLEDDVKILIRYAQCVGSNATPERLAALTSMLVEELGASAERLRLADSALAQSSTNKFWHPDAFQLVAGGLALLQASGITSPEAEQEFAARLHSEHHPAPKPFEWNRSRRRRLGWWLRRAWLTPVRLRGETKFQSGAWHRASICVRRRATGEIKYFVCELCRVAMIGNVEIMPEYQGLGLGQRAILRLHRRNPHYEWHTTAQYDTSGTFWPKVARLTGASFAHAEPCEHMFSDARSIDLGSWDDIDL
jgi:hypothetical protein